MEVRALRNSYNLIAAGYGGAGAKEYKFIDLAYVPAPLKVNLEFHHNYHPLVRKPISFLIHLFFFRTLYKKNNFLKFRQKKEYELLSVQNFDMVLVHHLNDLPMAARLAQEKKVKRIVNLHEYYPLEGLDEDVNWKQTQPEIINICKRELPKADAVFCVGKIIADKYKEEFGINATIVTNSKPYLDLQPVQADTGKIKLIHHGNAFSTRGLEDLIKMVDLLGDNYSLDLMLMPSNLDYYEELKRSVKDNKRVRIIAPVPTDEISKFINKYDIGVYICIPSNFNNLNCLPNKFFEFIQARLAIAIAPSPEMANLVRSYDLGVVAKDFTAESLADEIRKLSIEKIMHHKMQSHKNARHLSAEESEAIIKQTVDKLIS